MPIDALPSPGPSRRRPSTFAAEGDALLSALPMAILQANALEENVNAKEAAAAAAAVVAEEQAGLAAAQAVIAVTQANNALVSANFKGAWSALSGAATVPYCVFHAGGYWNLLTNLADVTTKEPGVDSEWAIMGVLWETIAANATAVKNRGYMADTSGGALTLTLPSNPSSGDRIWVADGSGTFDACNLTVERNGKKIMGFSEDMTVSAKYAAFSLVYSNEASGWRVIQ